MLDKWENINYNIFITLHNTDVMIIKNQVTNKNKRMRKRGLNKADKTRDE